MIVTSPDPRFKTLLQLYYGGGFQGESWSVDQVLAHLQAGGKAQGLISSNQLVAFLLYHQVNPSLEIIYLETHPTHRRRGHMSTLLKALLVGARVQSIWLEVASNNRAAFALYQKLGFQQTGVRPRYYRNGEDALMMTWQLPKSE